MSGVLQRKERREEDRGMKRGVEEREGGKERKKGGREGFWLGLPFKRITGVREQTFN